MGAIFLSASVPIAGRGNFYEDADPFLIHVAVRELLMDALGRRLIVWGGHPAITPMVWAMCEDLGVEYSSAVQLYQSEFFEDQYPEENERFRNVRYTPKRDSREASLLTMRFIMLAGHEFEAGVFIGGMEGIFDEFELFQIICPGVTCVVVASPGAAAGQLATRLQLPLEDRSTLDFSGLYGRTLAIPQNEERRNNLR